MIVLDEQLLGRGLESEIAAWYRGSVCFIHELRPQTVVKDDVIPTLLRNFPIHKPETNRLCATNC